MAGAPQHPVRDVFQESGEGSFDLRQIWHVLIGRAWLIVLFGLLGICGGFAYIKHTLRTFYTQAVVEVTPEEKKIVTFQDTEQQDLNNLGMAESLLARFRSRGFAREVIARNNLLADPDFLPGTLPKKRLTMEQGIDALLGMQSVLARRGTWFIDVGVQHPVPRMAKLLADAMADEFIRETLEQRSAASQSAVKFLLGKAKEVKNQLTESEQHLLAYVEESHSISLQEKQDTINSNLKTLSTQLLEAQAARIRLESDVQEVKRLAGDSEALLQVASVANHPMVVEQKRKIEYYESQVPILALKYTNKHPKMIQARAQIAEAKASLLEIAARLPRLIQSAYEGAVATEQKFVIAVGEQEKRATELNRQAIEYGVRAREVEINRALYESLLKQLKQTEIAKGIESSNIRIFEGAMEPTVAVQARRSKILIIALAIGLGSGVGLTFGLHAIDSSLQTVDQAEQVTRLPVVGAIPRASSTELAKAGMELYYDPGGVTAEAFRTLRTSLYLTGRGKGRDAVLFTSAVPAEGKTFTSMNYAIALAQQGLRTLLIDADLRAPLVESVLLPAEPHEGLADYLGRGASKDQVIHPTIVSNLSVLPAGPLASNPAELLAGPRLGELMQELRASFDRIVIDTAPVMAVSDTLLFVEHADMVCLVVRVAKTPRKWVLRATSLLTNAGAKPVGLVLNQLSTRSGAGYNLYVGKYGSVETYGTRRTSPAENAPEPAELQPSPRNTAV